MAFQNDLTTFGIRAIFAEEIAAAGGSVANAFDDGNRLFMRAILPAEAEVKTKDSVRGGVAIRATEEEISIHPYVFRQVCKNGAIIAHAIESRHLTIADVPFDTEEAIVEALREAIQLCCSEEAFRTAASEMRLTARTEVDTALALMPMLSRLRAEFAPEILTAIVDRFFDARDNSPFGLLNAVTSVARDTSDPDVRWRLEVIGGDFPLEVNHREQAHAREMELLSAQPNSGARGARLGDCTRTREPVAAS
jgi:hypothetical protein